MKNRKWNIGDTVIHRSMRWTVCRGGVSDPAKKVYRYKLARGAWKQLVAGNCITSAVA